MGMNRRWSSGAEPAPGNPDPRSFEILEVERIGRLWLSVLVYRGCTNFEGRKVLLTNWNPWERTEIDPHFAEGSGILARFEPSADGMRAGRMLAEAIAGGAR